MSDLDNLANQFQHLMDTLKKIAEYDLEGSDPLAICAVRQMAAEVAMEYGMKIEAEPTPKIFSGDYSREMWEDINSARTKGDLRRALYFVCCRIQNLESKYDSGWLPENLRR